MRGVKGNGAVSSELVRELNSKLRTRGGESTAGDEYGDLHELWTVELRDQEETGQPKWYSKALAFWDNEQNCPPTVDGVLGGFGHVSGVDLTASREFLRQLRELAPAIGRQQAVECGAGIGRVVKGLLLDHFEHVELVEPSQRLLRAAQQYLEPFQRQCTFTCVGMQEYFPPDNSLDLVWIQWAIGHLTDADFFSFLGRCAKALRPGGVVCLKENCAADGFVVDSDDSSIIRTKEYFYRVFEIANMELVYEMEQEYFPDELFPVFMFAIRPKPSLEEDDEHDRIETEDATEA